MHRTGRRSLVLALVALGACRTRRAHDAPVAPRSTAPDASLVRAAAPAVIEAVDSGSGPIVIGAAYPSAGFSRVVALALHENVEHFDCQGASADTTDVHGMRPYAPQVVVNVIDRPRRVRVWARGRGSYALVVSSGPDDDRRCAVQAGAEASLDLGTLAAGAHLDVWAASVDGGSLDVRVGALTDGNPVPALAAPAIPALAAGEVRGWWELRDPHADDGALRTRLVLTGAVERVIDLPDLQYGTCRGDPGPLPGYLCQIGGFSTYGVYASRRGGYEIRVSSESDGACDGPHGEHVECPVEVHVVSRFTLPAGTRLRTDPRGSLRFIDAPSAAP